MPGRAPQTEWTILIIMRAIVLNFGNWHRLAASLEIFPIEFILRQIFFCRNCK
jgi:hypothetical protein